MSTWNENIRSVRIADVLGARSLSRVRSATPIPACAGSSLLPSRKAAIAVELGLVGPCTAARQLARESDLHGPDEARLIRLAGGNRSRDCGLAPELHLLRANGVSGSASVTAAIGLCGRLHLLRRTEMMTALVFGFLLSL